MEMRIKANNRGGCAELRESDKEGGGIEQYTHKPYLLCCEQAREHEESSEKAHRNAYIRCDGAFYTLSCYDTHSLFFYFEQFNLEDEC
jgi:hypothetical protein